MVEISVDKLKISPLKGYQEVFFRISYLFAWRFQYQTAHDGRKDRMLLKLPNYILNIDFYLFIETLKYGFVNVLKASKSILFCAK